MSTYYSCTLKNHQTIILIYIEGGAKILHYFDEVISELGEDLDYMKTVVKVKENAKEIDALRLFIWKKGDEVKSFIPMIAVTIPQDGFPFRFKISLEAVSRDDGKSYSDYYLFFSGDEKSIAHRTNMALAMFNFKQYEIESKYINSINYIINDILNREEWMGRISLGLLYDFVRDNYQCELIR